MLFNELDIEKQLDSCFTDSKLYCSARPICQDGTNPNFFGNCKDGKEHVWVPDTYPRGEDGGPVDSKWKSGNAGRDIARKQDEIDVAIHNDEPLPDHAAAAKALAAEKKARWVDQCFLVEGWKEIVDKFNVCDKQLDNSGYKNVIPVVAPSAEIVSILANRENANLFFTLSPAQLAMLVPTIRLFIVRFKEQDVGGKKIIVEDDEPQELYLDDHTESKLVQDIMTGASGRANAIGLESFTYEFDGKNPKETDVLIKANLTLIMNSFERLTKKQDNGAKFLDLLLRTSKMVKQTRDDKIAKEKDNIYNFCKNESAASAKENKTNETSVFNPDHKIIKASVGWAIPEGDLFFHLFPPDVQASVTPTFKKNVINMLESLKLHLTLGMVSYDIDFKNDGKVQLSIDYRASIETELNDPESNIFFLLKNEIKKLNDLKDERVSAAARRREEKNKQIKGNNSGETDEQKDSLKKASKDYTTKKQDIENRNASVVYADKLKWYSRFLDELQANNRLIMINLSRDALDVWKGNRDFANPDEDIRENPDQNTDDPNQAESGALSAGEILKLIFDGNGDETLYGKYRVLNDDNPDTAAGKDCVSDRTKPLKEAAGRAIDTGADADSAAKAKKDAQEILKQTGLMYEDQCPAPPGTRNLYLTFMGDILETAMKFVNEINTENTKRESTVRLLTSQITFTDPSSSLKGENRREALNIADIPVSLDEFIQWFFNNVVKSGKVDYPVMEFIKDAITHLAVQAFGYNCIGGTQFTPILNHTMFDLPRLANRKEPLEPGKRYNTINPLRKAKKALNLTLTKAPSEVINYIIINGAARTFVNRNSDDLEQDEKDGIYHFGIGLNRGILKEINFSGTELKYATEARIIDQGVEGINQLFRKFDATVTLYGCPIFRNGQYLFLDPRTMGVGSDIARAMGMGGYYHVYNVAGKITRSNYTMDLKCNYQGSGLCGDETIDNSRNLCGGDWPESRTAQEMDAAIDEAREAGETAASPEEARARAGTLPGGGTPLVDVLGSGGS